MPTHHIPSRPAAVRRIVASLLCMATTGWCAACNGVNTSMSNESTAVNDASPTTGNANQRGTDASDNNTSHTDTQEQAMTTITITIGGTDYDAALASTPAAAAFADMLPMTLRMDELNSNEKYHYLDASLPSEPQSVTSIETGDLMLYGSDCIVLFYQSFRTPYSYTRLGHINNPHNLAATLGSGAIEATFTAR